MNFSHTPFSELPIARDYTPASAEPVPAMLLINAVKFLSYRAVNIAAKLYSCRDRNPDYFFRLPAQLRSHLTTKES